MPFILLIDVKMPTIVGILTFVSWINTAYGVIKQETSILSSFLVFYEQSKFHAKLS